ncbi:MAG: hypothetical protein ACAI35_09300 [Candidatus Methylacidiphilales bacterium]|nr:hypothetical protein [Candidatus Methylacidiphilales bacterium]
MSDQGDTSQSPPEAFRFRYLLDEEQYMRNLQAAMVPPTLMMHVMGWWFTFLSGIFLFIAIREVSTNGFATQLTLWQYFMGLMPFVVATLYWFGKPITRIFALRYFRKSIWHNATMDYVLRPDGIYFANEQAQTHQPWSYFNRVTLTPTAVSLKLEQATVHWLPLSALQTCDPDTMPGPTDANGQPMPPAERITLSAPAPDQAVLGAFVHFISIQIPRIEPLHKG